MIDEVLVKDALAAALATGGDFAEIFAEDRSSTSIRLEDRRVEDVTSGRDRGAGVRVIRGESTAYAYTNRLDRDAILDAAKAAAAAMHDRPGAQVLDLMLAPERALNPVRRPPGSVDASEKVAAVVRIDEAARSAGGEVRQVIVSFSEGTQKMLVANSEGALATDERTRTRVSCTVVAARDGVIQNGHFGPGASTGFELFEAHPPDVVAKRAADQALAMLASIPAPAGEMPVVLSPGGGGVLFHEASGHGLEADLIHKGASLYNGREGQRIASELVTGVDSGEEAGSWGSFGYDDEGTPSRRNVLIDKGVLTGFMTDVLRARAMGLARSGNGRRQSYQHLPIPRMTNSFLVPGDDDPDEIVRQVKKGLYAKSFGGGQVNTASGDFVFGLTEAYLIENGQLTTPVRGANLIGNGPAVLQSIDAVGRDWESWTGICGKDGQGVPVTAGMPTVRVARITVGGTAS